MIQFINDINEMMKTHQFSLRGWNTSLEIPRICRHGKGGELFDDVASLNMETDSGV